MWYKLTFVIFLILLLLSLAYIIPSILGLYPQDYLIFVPAFVIFIGILYQAEIILAAVLKKSWKLFLWSEVVFLVAWLVLWLLFDNGKAMFASWITVVISLVPLFFFKRLHTK